jgi:tyrosyl-tRNA synthetase
MNIEQQIELIMQGTEYGDENLYKAMESELRQRLQECEKEGRKLRVYCGYDPRTPDLHIGHTVTMQKLRTFQDLGHEVTFVIGTFTSLIGDPSDQDKLRPRLTMEQVLAHGATYSEQAFRILKREQTIIRYNHEWLASLTLEDMINLGANFTVQQMLTRETFRDRFDKNDPLYIHEFFYSMMQGYDAYALDTDVQVGGTDQMFNIMTAGRKVMESKGKRPNIAIILGLLPGTDGDVKMSKSIGNHIALNTTPEDMYGKVMSVPDKAMNVYSRLVTRWLPEEVRAFEAALKDGSLHPRDAKMKLAHAVTSVYYSPEEAEKAQAAFVNLFQQGNVPTDMPEVALKPEETVLDLLINNGLVASKSEGRRLIEQNGVKLDGAALTRGDVPLPHAGVLSVGKRRFVRVK